MSTKYEEPLDLSGLSKADYRSLYLRMNPFPALGIPEEVPTTTADRRDIMELFRNLLRTTLFEGKSTIAVLTGDYGAGKSHLLKFFKHRVNTQLLTSKNKALAIYIKSVGRDFSDLYLYLIDDLGRDFMTNYAIQLIRSYLSKLGESKARKYVIQGPLIKEGMSVAGNIEEFLRNSQFLDLFHDIQASFKSVKNSDPVQALLMLAHPDYSSVAWRWFLGENLSKEEREFLIVERNIESQQDAQTMLHSMIGLLNESGITAVVLLIDEFEKFTLIPKLSRDRYMDDLRHFIDDNPHGVCMVIGVTPTAYQTLNEVPSALTRRLKGNEKELSFFKIDDVEELITNYLRLGRLEKADMSSVISKYPETTADLYPFTKDSIKRIDEISKGLVSTIVNLCRQAIEKAVDEKLPVIDSNTINQVAA